LPKTDLHICHADRESQSEPARNPESDRRRSALTQNPRLSDDQPRQADPDLAAESTQPPAYTDSGIPGTVLAPYLRENNIVPEKYYPNSILFLRTPPIEPGECGSLISRLAAFKQLYDADEDLSNVLQSTLATYP
jgi:hypothetical protein